MTVNGGQVLLMVNSDRTEVLMYLLKVNGDDVFLIVNKI